MGKADKPEDVKDVSEEKKDEVVGSLDEVHDQTINELEANLEESEDDTQDDNSGEDDGDTADEEADAAGEDDAEAEADSVEPEPVPEPKEAPAAPEPAPELDTDTSKPGQGKVAVKDFDGKTHYFNNLDEVPEDFEPASYKAFAKFTREIIEKEQQDKIAARERAEEQERKAQDERVSAIREGWNKDIETLTKEGVLPKDTTERDKVTKEVFALMDKELEAGRILDFAPAFEIYQYRQSKQETDARIKEEKDDKKKRGARVQGAGSGATGTPSRSSTAGRTIEAPPPGVSLDDIHSNVLGSL